MADAQPSPTIQINGDDIISEILRNCEAGMFKIRRTVILPCIYHLYLHPSDSELIQPVIPALTAEARSALIDRLEELQAAGKPSGIARTLGFDSRKPMEYKILDPDWTIEFHADAEEKLGRGEIEIYSELASAARPEFEGAMTRHVTRRLSAGQTTSSAAVPGAVTATARAGDRVSAYIRYEEAGSPQSFPVTKNQIVIGRGGKAFWVDVKVSAPPDVSREHCRIRRDESTGRFFIKDVSQYGTSVNGSRIPSSLEDRNGGQRDKNVEVPLPPRCRINLADVFILDFEAVEDP
jgi:pSer/pThr/pTyr-binding forkhead associated (FHA) protein